MESPTAAYSEAVGVDFEVGCSSTVAEKFKFGSIMSYQAFSSKVNAGLHELGPPQQRDI